MDTSSPVRNTADPGRCLRRSPGGIPVLSGVVDWAGVRIGDPANDLASISATYGPAFLEQVPYTAWTDPQLTVRVAAIRGSFVYNRRCRVTATVMTRNSRQVLPATTPDPSPRRGEASSTAARGGWGFIERPAKLSGPRELEASSRPE